MRAEADSLNAVLSIRSQYSLACQYAQAGTLTRSLSHTVDSTNLIAFQGKCDLTKRQTQ